MNDDALLNNFDLDNLVNGEWLSNQVLPDHETEISTFKDISNRVKDQLKDVLKNDDHSESLRSMTEYALLRDIHDRYHLRSSSNDGDEFRQVTAIIDQIDEHLRDRDVGSVIGILETNLLNPLFSTSCNEDPRDTQNVRLTLCFPSLTLPDRVYYIDPSYADKVKAYEANIDRVLHIIDDMTNSSHNLSAVSGSQIVAIETEMAKAIKTVEERRDMDSLYSRLPILSFIDSVSLCGLGLLDCNATQAIWTSYFDKAVIHPGIDHKTKVPQEIIVYDMAYFQKLSKILIDTPLTVMRSYLAYKMAVELGSLNIVTLDEPIYEFYGKALSGQQQDYPIDDKVYGMIDRTLGEQLGRVYVAKFFDRRSKGVVENMVTAIRSEMQKSIENNKWMTRDTKVAAQKKLQNMSAKIGYPDVPIDRSVMEDGIRKRLDSKSTMVGITIFMRKCYYIQDVLAKIDTPKDPNKWSMNPHDVNAYYDPQMNEIAFPAGILNDPIFNPNNSMGANYGALGTVIGHEISHGFDDQGRKYDHDGNIDNWWSDDDLVRFQQYANRMVKQYEEYTIDVETANGTITKSVNGLLTLGENIADLGGVDLALRALINEGHEDQMREFFLSYAKLWRKKLTPDKMLMRIESDPHSPAKYRVWVVRNIDKFYEVFPEALKSQMHLPEHMRIKMF